MKNNFIAKRRNTHVQKFANAFNLSVWNFNPIFFVFLCFLRVRFSFREQNSLVACFFLSMGVINSRLSQRVSPSGRILPVDGAVSVLPQSLHSSNTIGSKYVVVWIDPDINQADIIYQNSMNRLQRVFISLRTYMNVKEAMKFISSTRNQSILLVVSSECVHDIWSRVKNLSQVHSVYILTPEDEEFKFAEQDSPKIQGVSNRVETICSALKRGTRHFNADLLVMSVIPSVKFTKKDLPQLNQLFIYWMLVKQIILETKYDLNESIKELSRFCRGEYFSNANELKIIDEFEKSYEQHTPIWWYTRECFVSTLLSRALQTQDIEIIIRMGFFIKDLHQQIESLKTTKLPIVAYRSQNVSKEDFDKMKDIKGNLLAFNNFIMADLDSKASIDAARRARDNPNSVGVVFRFRIESKQTSSPYAFVQNHSFSPERTKSILFSMHSVFRINDIKQLDNQLWEIDLILTDTHDEHINSLGEVLKTEIQDTTSWYKLAQFMTIIRDNDHARDIYFALLELIPESDVLKMAHIYNELGVLDDAVGDYTSALQFYQKSIDIRRQYLPPNHRSLSVSYNNIGEVQRQMGDYHSALSTHQKTLDMKQKSVRPNALSIATTYNNIGLASELLGEYSKALEFYQKAVEVKRRALPTDHQELATTYNNIGELQRAMGNFTAALSNLEKALNIRLKKYSPMDPSLAITYNNIGLIHRELGDFSKALIYLEKSLEVKLKHFPANHSSFAITYNNIGDIRHQMAEYDQALAAYQTAFDIQEKTLPPNHPELATTYTNMGVAEQAMGNFQESLEHYEKALAIRKKALPANHPSIGISYNNIGHVHQMMGEYSAANGFYQKTLKIQQKSLPADHPSLAATYNNLADIQRKLDNSKKALVLYKKSLDIKKKTLPPHHPTLVITYNNMGVMYQSLKKYADALNCYKQTLEIQQKTLPPNHPDLAAVYNNVGVSHQSLKEYSTALEYYEKAMKIQQKALPTNHPDIAMTHNSMATVLVNLGDYKGALKHEQKAVDIASHSLSADHPHLLTFLNYLARIQAKIESLKDS